MKQMTHQWGRRQRETAWFYTLVSPWLIGFALFTFIPMAIGILASFTNYNGINLNSLRFVGLRNYERIFTDRQVGIAIVRTLEFGGLLIVLSLTLSIIIAYLLTRNVRGKSILRAIFYIPSVLPIVSAVAVWRFLMADRGGLVNDWLTAFTGQSADILWLSSHGNVVLLLFSLWVGLGGGMLIFMAGFEGIPKDLEHAAQMDGANPLQIFQFVTLPLITPAIFFQLIMLLIYVLQTYITPLLLTPGQSGLSTIPPNETYFYMVHAFRQVFTHQRIGYGTALINLLFMFMLLLTLFLFSSSRWWVYYEVERDRT